MNKIVWAQNRISKTIARRYKPKTKSFSNSCTFKSTAVLYLRINSTSDDQSALTQALFSKMSKRPSSNFEKKNAFWKIDSSVIYV